MGSRARPAPVWLFDLDNTLHNAGASAFRHFDGAMNRYIEDTLGVLAQEADRLRAHYWAHYGNTLVGLVRHHGVQVEHFVRLTHAFPGLEGELAAHGHDLAALKRLPGRKIVLTNAGRGYAVRVLRALGVLGCFEAVIGVEQMHCFGDLRPKPDARMLRLLAAPQGEGACSSSTSPPQTGRGTVSTDASWPGHGVTPGQSGRRPAGSAPLTTALRSRHSGP